MALPSAGKVKPGASSVQAMQFRSKGYCCQAWLMLRSVTHSSAPPSANLAKPERWPMSEGSIYEGVANCAMSHFWHYEPMTRPCFFLGNNSALGCFDYHSLSLGLGCLTGCFALPARGIFKNTFLCFSNRSKERIAFWIKMLYTLFEDMDLRPDQKVLNWITTRCIESRKAENA